VRQRRRSLRAIRDREAIRARQRPVPYVWVSWLTKPLVGEETCRWRLWFKAHNKFDKVPSDFDLARWTADHTQLVNSRADQLRADGYAVFLEGQNDFVVTGANGAKLSGKADIVAINEEDSCVIDCKTGKERHSDKLQVLLYMLMLPRTVNHCRGRVLRGEVRYTDHVIPIDPSAVDDKFKAMLRTYMDMAASDQAPPKAPSHSECRFCEITSADCPERIDEPTAATETDLF